MGSSSFTSWLGSVTKLNYEYAGSRARWKGCRGSHLSTNIIRSMTHDSLVTHVCIELVGLHSIYIEVNNSAGSLTVCIGNYIFRIIKLAGDVHIGRRGAEIIELVAQSKVKL